MTREYIQNVPPHSEESEKMVLGGILIDPGLIEEIYDILNPDDFYIPANKIIYSAIISLYQNNKPFDLPTLQDYLTSKKLIKKIQGGAIYLASLFDSIAAPSSALHYAKIVKKKSIIRQGIHICSNLIADFFDHSKNDDPDKLIENAQQKLFELSINKNQNKVCHIKETINEIIQYLIASQGQQSFGIQTGYYELDDIIGGFRPGDFIIIAGRPSMGKTAFAFSCMYNIANQGIPVGLLSLEMSNEQMAKRAIAFACSINLGKILKCKLGTIEKEQLLALQFELPIYIDDSPGLTTMQIRNRARRMKQQYGIEALFIDYLQLAKSAERVESREREIAEISSTLKAIAKELQIPVIALSQLNRKVEERTDKRPKLSDLRESGAIEQDADIILFLYRDAVYKKNLDENQKNIAEIIVGKQRNGPLGTVKLLYEGEYTRFKNLNVHYAEDNYAD